MIRMADKTATFLLMNTDECLKKIIDRLSDILKFIRIMRNPVEEIIRRSSGIIIYRTVKTYKPSNPFCPIISKIPSCTFTVAKALTRILPPYVPSRYSLKSSTGLLQVLRKRPCGGIIASLDMESLPTSSWIRSSN